MERQQLDDLQLPDQPGVYTFRDARGKPLYIGKATSLRDRVRSYFASDLREARGDAIVRMVGEATDVTWQETDSVLEALVLEANEIKRRQPPYNVRERDDKSFNYVVITKEAYPQVLRIRGRELATRWDESEIKYTFGPFPHGAQLKEALRLIRKIFPFRDSKCTPAREQKRGPRPCFNRQIGLCPGVCTGEVSTREYGRTIQHLRLFFQGKKSQLLERLERDMHAAAQREQFEQAAEVRRQIYALQHIQDVSLLKHDVERQSSSRRIEAYDVAHTAEQERVGVMTVVSDGQPQKGDYRKFKIRRRGGGDTGALTEILQRRLEHPEWPYPQLIVVDGGKAQVNATLSTLTDRGMTTPVVGVVKDEKHRPREIIGADAQTRAQREREILLANSEAHRFALTFHRHRRRSAQ